MAKEKKSIIGYKWRIYGILFIILVSIGLRLVQNNSLIPAFGVNTGVIQVIEDTEKVSLNQWLANYHEGAYQKISLTNDKDLKGFSLLKKAKESLLFGREYETEVYRAYQTEKSASLNLIDLGVALTGDIEVAIVHEEPSLRNKLLEQVGYLIFFLIILVLGMRFIMPKGGPGSVL